MTKYIFILIISILLIFTVEFLFFSAPKVKHHASADQPIVVFGDSLVSGAATSQGNDMVTLLSRKLGLDLINAGTNGDTTQRALARVDHNVLSRKPGLVIVLLGGNDALQQVPVQQTFANLATIIERIKASEAQVLLLGVPGGFLNNLYGHEFERLATEHDMDYIPNILEGILGHPDYMADPIHPNEKGNQKMADRIAPVLKEMLRNP